MGGSLKTRASLGVPLGYLNPEFVKHFEVCRKSIALSNVFVNMTISLDAFVTFLGQLRTEPYVFEAQLVGIGFTPWKPKPGYGVIIAKNVAKPWNYHTIL